MNNQDFEHGISSSRSLELIDRTCIALPRRLGAEIPMTVHIAIEQPVVEIGPQSQLLPEIAHRCWRQHRHGAVEDRIEMLVIGGTGKRDADSCVVAAQSTIRRLWYSR